jgi:amidase
MPGFRTAFVPHDLTAAVVGAGTGSLAGLTAVVKDMYDIAGERTGGGSPEWLEEQAPAAEHAWVVAQILDAGATVTGKTVCDEFFYSISGINAHYGTPVNSRAVGRIPGGSSSGSASAAASGVCDFALGSDTGGSVRVPASLCGLYGIRPTHGRVDFRGAMAMAPSFDVAGWLSASPGVFRRVGETLLGGTPDKTDPARLILVDDAFEEADGAVSELLRWVLDAIRNHLPTQSHERLATEGLDTWRECFRILQAQEVWSVYGNFIKRRQPDLGPGIRERFEFAAAVSDRTVAKASEKRTEARARIRSLAQPATVLVIPTCPSIAPSPNDSQDIHELFRQRVMRLTCISGLSGLPQVTIPIGTVAGAPVGLSFIGWAGGDERLLQLAQDLARFCGVAHETSIPMDQ